MQILDAIEQCSGCHACYSACPQRCITMQADAEGFLRPVVYEEKCISCGLCKRVCHVLSGVKLNGGTAHACVSTDEELRLESSSGGVFSLLAKSVLQRGGVVYGAALDETFTVRHVEVSSEAGIPRLRGSKYVQSQIGSCYIQAKERLEAGKTVFFSGTPCQIQGLKSFLGREYDNLILQDIICHGVPSPKVWKKWIECAEKKQAANAKGADKVRFRSKENGWRQYSLVMYFDNGKVLSESMDKNNYLRAFANDLSLRPSCYQCHAKGKERASDITLADCWGIEKLLPEADDNKGTSLVLIHSEKGKKLFETILGQMWHQEIDRDKALAFNTSAYQSAICPKNRERFFELLDKTDFETALNKCIPKRGVRKYIGKLKRLIKRMCRKHV